MTPEEKMDNVLAKQMSKIEKLNDEWEPDEETSTEECHRCGELRPCIYQCDPYVKEIHGEETEFAWWCKQCFEQMAADI